MPHNQRMKSSASLDPAIHSLLIRTARTIQEQRLPERRAAWRMRWAERFVNFVVQQQKVDRAERFVGEVAATRSATPWLLQEIQEAIAVVFHVAEPSELTQSSPASLEMPRPYPSQQPITTKSSALPHSFFLETCQRVQRRPPAICEMRPPCPASSNCPRPTLLSSDKLPLAQQICRRSENPRGAGCE